MNRRQLLTALSIGLASGRAQQVTRPRVTSSLVLGTLSVTLDEGIRLAGEAGLQSIQAASLRNQEIRLAKSRTDSYGLTVDAIWANTADVQQSLATAKQLSARYLILDNTPSVEELTKIGALAESQDVALVLPQQALVERAGLVNGKTWIAMPGSDLRDRNPSVIRLPAAASDTELTELGKALKKASINITVALAGPLSNRPVQQLINAIDRLREAMAA